jgi:pyrroline-5-carboxylate reductase
MSLKNKTIAFIGAGNMGEALIRGLLAAKAVAPQQLVATDVLPERLALLESKFGIRTMSGIPQADILVLAVKPQQMSEVLSTLKPQISNLGLIVTIAAGVTTARIERELGGNVHVVRVMPNSPALIGAGAAALARGKFASDDDLATAEAILGAVGITVRVDEELLDAVTALSGSGPAYVFLIAEAMIKAGIEIGLTPDVSKKLTLQTILGAGKLMIESSEEPSELRRKVTSPGGTTEAAVKVMTDRKLSETFSEAIAAAKRRGRELSGS